ncbi:MAG: fibronectin type III domain-containing protein [Pyrinomonadaceae bacterium]
MIIRCNFPQKAGRGRRLAKAAPVCLLIALIIASGPACGKRKPPLPPVQKVPQRAEIKGFQRGNNVILSWPMPEKNAPPNDVQHILRIDVYRLAEPLTSPLTLSEEEFSARSLLIASVPVEDSDFGGKTFTYRDTLEFAGQPVRLRYAVRFVNAAGQKAAFSNFLLVEPEAKVAAAPTALEAEVTQEAIELSWTGPAANADGTTPVNIFGYNVYRSESETQAGKLINQNPVPDPKFSDENFDFEKKYFYFVRAVSSGTGATRTESLESNIVEVMPVDKFPPSALTSITIAASPTTISIFFPPNPENDVTGYKIYRSEDGTVPKAEWKLLTGKQLETNTFQDTSVEPGKTYFYYVISIDKFGNESAPSEVVSDRTPPSDDDDRSVSTSGIVKEDSKPAEKTSEDDRPAKVNANTLPANKP